jgi:hypothetical protein
VLAYAEDYPGEEARFVIQRLGELDIAPAASELATLMPDWDLQ